MNLRFIDWIWHLRGSLALTPGQTNDDAFDKLDALFRQDGTTHERSNHALMFQKKDQAAQDKMSIFDHGILRIEQGMAGPVLRYHLISRALLFCFLAPFLFLGIAQLTIAIGRLDKPETQAEKAAKASKKPVIKPVPMSPIDKALGAPEPDKPGKNKADDDDKKQSPTPAYVFAAIFAVLWGVGRILEDRLIKRLFQRSLYGL